LPYKSSFDCIRFGDINDGPQRASQAEPLRGLNVGIGKVRSVRY